MLELSMMFSVGYFLLMVGGIWKLIEWLVEGKLDVEETRLYFAYLLILALLSPISIISLAWYTIVIVLVTTIYIVMMIKRSRGKK